MLFILFEVLGTHIFHFLKLFGVLPLQVISAGVFIFSLVDDIHFEVFALLFDLGIAVILDSVNRLSDFLGGHLQLLCVVREVV